MFFMIFAPLLRPKTAPKSMKITPETHSGFWRRSETVFHRFLLNFRGLRTSKSMLPCTREHDFRKITVFVPGPLLGPISCDFTSVFDPQNHKKRCRKRSWKTSGFLTSFLLVFGDFGDPFGSPLRAQNRPWPAQNRPKTFPGANFPLPGTNFPIFGANFRNCAWNLIIVWPPNTQKCAKASQNLPKICLHPACQQTL